MRLQLIRLLLLHRHTSDIFDQWGGKAPNRETWIRRILSERIDFTHRKVPFYYVPDQSESTEFLSGRIGRQRVVRENEPPDEGLEEKERQAWKAGRVVIDPTHHEDGQKAAVEISADIGRPAAVFRSLASAVNHRITPEPYVLEANGISDPATFWKFVEDNEHDINHVRFEMWAPNMFGVRSRLEKEMKELRDNEKAQKVELTLESDEGLNLNTTRTKETARYTSDGGGNISATTLSGRKFSSTNKVKTITVEEDKTPKTGLIREIWVRMTEP